MISPVVAPVQLPLIDFGMQTKKVEYYISETPAIERTGLDILYIAYGMTAWNTTSLVNIVYRIILPLGLILLAFYTIPTSICMVVLPIVGAITLFGGNILASWLNTPQYQERLISAQPFVEEKFERSWGNFSSPLENRSLLQPQTSLVDLTPAVPRQLLNTRNNCWANSLAQLLRLEKSFVEWIRNVPADLFKLSHWAIYLPQHLLFTKEELQAHPAPPLPMTPLLSIPSFKVWSQKIDEEFAKTLEFSDDNANLPELQNDRKAYFTHVKKTLFDWAKKIPELHLLPADLAVTDEYLNLFPTAEREMRTRYATGLIREIKKLDALKLTPDEKKEVDSILTDLREAQTAFRKFIALDNAATISLDSDEIKKIIQGNPIEIRGWMQTYQNIKKLSVAEREQVLRYVNLTQASVVDKRDAVIHALSRFKEFLEEYQAAVKAEKRGLNFDTKKLRFAMHDLNDQISLNPEQEDAADALRILESLFPPELKVSMCTKKFYKSPSGDKEVEVVEESIGNLSIELSGTEPNVDTLIKDYLTSTAEHEKVSSGGVEYTVEKTEVRFEKAPETLWVQLKRFDKDLAKIKTNVELPEIVKIPLKDGTEATYQLDSFIICFGETISSGHYVANIKDVDKEGNEIWYEANDDRIFKLKADQAKFAKNNAYITHYTKVTT